MPFLSTILTMWSIWCIVLLILTKRSNRSGVMEVGQTTEALFWDVQVTKAAFRNPVLFLHGLGLDRQQWNRELQELQGSRPAAALSLPGQGGTSRPNEPLSLESLAAWVMKWVHGQSWGAVHLVGCSLGGLVAWEILRQEPQAVASVLTFGSAPKLDLPQPAVKAGAWLVDGLFASHYPKAYAKFAARSTSRKPTVRRQLEGAFEDAARHWQPSLYQLRTVIGRYDYLDVLEKADVPLAIVAGKYDNAVNPHLAQYWPQLQHNSNITRIDIACAGHVANWDEPETFQAVLDQWLTEVDSGE